MPATGARGAGCLAGGEGCLAGGRGDVLAGAGEGSEAGGACSLLGLVSLEVAALLTPSSCLKYESMGIEVSRRGITTFFQLRLEEEFPLLTRHRLGLSLIHI